MKKTSAIISILIVSICLNAQISYLNINSSKTYDNDITTSYGILSGYIPQDLLIDLCTHIESHPDVLKFSFYDSSNYKSFMYSAKSSFDPLNIIDLINDFIEEFIAFDSSDDLANTEYFEDDKAVKFIIQGIINENQKEEIIDQISLEEGIISMEINPNNICKLTIHKGITKHNIIEIFESYSLSIIEMHNR